MTSSPAGPTESTHAPDRVRMPLLDLITAQALDEDYESAVRGRAARVPRTSRRRSATTAAVVVAVFGLLVTVSALQTERNSAVDDESRTSLIARIDARKQTLARRQQRQATLSARNLATQRRLVDLTTQAQAATSRNQRIAAQAGFAAQSGSGVAITVTQAADADDNQQVKPLDLALIVNGLWAAGADAVSINDQRITARSSVLSSGRAIEVNDIGVSSPFEISAIGDPRTLQGRFFDTTSGLDFVTIAQQYGIAYTVQNVGQLDLPAAPSSLRSIRSAQVMPATSDSGASSGPEQGATKNSDPKGGSGS